MKLCSTPVKNPSMQLMPRMYLPIPSSMNRVWYKVSFKLGTAGLNSEFSFSLTGCLIKTKDISLFYYFFRVSEGRGFMPFIKAFARREKETASSRIWTRVADSISYVDNHCTLHASLKRFIPSNSQCGTHAPPVGHSNIFVGHAIFWWSLFRVDSFLSFRRVICRNILNL